jgi:GDP-L-fucose synthase
LELNLILVTGSTGFLGRHAIRSLENAYGRSSVVGVSSRDYDLMDRRLVDLMFEKLKPTVVVHLAAYSGGIGANRTYPADFYYRNSILTANVFDAAAHHRVLKLVYPMGGCSYPANGANPLSEDLLWTGFPQKESAPYSTAKMMGTVAASAYRQQYGLNATVIIPGNMYGEFDNFSQMDSHVVPAMIRRYHEAYLAGSEAVEQWGSGAPRRDFVYAGDVAATLPFFIENFDEVGPVNISSGTETSIKSLATLIAKLSGFEGRIDWDSSKPDGQMVKIFSTKKLSSLGLQCATPLDEGLERTIGWFSKNYESRGDGLRL